jgi:putative inorganic carbon (HCO3(-)) transporter
MSWRVPAALTLVSWGALAFGAVYPWAFLPLFALSAACGTAALLQSGERSRADPALAAALFLLVAAIALQLLPIPVAVLEWLSPETDAFLRRYAVDYRTASATHPISIDPRLTARALAGAASLSLLFLGFSRTLTHDDTRQIVRGVIVLGVVVAVIGVVQKTMWTGRIYGFWTPEQAGASFGPFVNRNHYAGWMLMAVPLAMGYFCGRVARHTQQLDGGWRSRLLWFGSSDASATILVGVGTLLMAAALAQTMSRSGIMGLMVALVIACWFVARRQLGGVRAAMATGAILLVAIAILWSTGFDRLAARFAERGSSDLGGRIGIWTDTWSIVQRFPLTGTGLNTFGKSTLYYQTTNLSLHFNEAHSDYLQLLAEGGLLVGIPAALAIAAFARTVRRRLAAAAGQGSDYWIRAGAITGLAAIAVQEAVDFSLQMPGNAVLFVMVLALAARQSRAPTVRPRTLPA